MSPGLSRERAESRPDAGTSDRDARLRLPETRSTAEPASVDQSRSPVPDLVVFSGLFVAYVAALAALGAARGGRWLGRQVRSAL